MRTDFLSTGIFGLLSADHSAWQCFTLEHAYQDFNQNPPEWVSKLPAGIYLCKRGMHQLTGMKAPFETFEITNVPGHSEILFHMGNFNDDSAGCVLLGGNRQGDQSISHSIVTFNSFMNLLEGINAFELTVI